METQIWISGIIAVIAFVGVIIFHFAEWDEPFIFFMALLLASTILFSVFTTQKNMILHGSKYEKEYIYKVNDTVPYDSIVVLKIKE
jgi:hypothetical protein